MKARKLDLLLWKEKRTALRPLAWRCAWDHCLVSWPCETGSFTLNPWILWVSKEFTIDSMTPMCPNHHSSITGLTSDVFVLICCFWFLANHLYFGLACHMCVRNTKKFKIKMLLTIIWLPEPHLKKQILNNFHIYLFILIGKLVINIVVY